MRSPRLPRILREDHGQDLIEYAVIAAFVALVAIVGAQALHGALDHLYEHTSSKVNAGANFTTNSSATTGCAPHGDAITPDPNSTTPPQTDDAKKASCK